MRLRSLSAAVLALSVFAPAAALAAPPAKLKLPELKYETYTLPNGLKVITHEDHRLPLVAVDLWYHVGPLNERAGRTGFAHLFEHMMFEGSEHVGEKAHIKYVEGAGATDVNGTTNFDRTNYFETLPANQLELALWLESDRMGFLMEGLDRTKLTNQRDVVRNERRQGEGQPYSAAREKMFQLLFPVGHPYYGDVIGSHADIEAARIADVRDFHQQFYTPNNATIAIAGDFTPAQLKAMLTRYFGPIPKGPDTVPVTIANTPTPPIATQRRATVTDTVKLPQLTVAFLTPPAYTPGDKQGEVLAQILTGGKSARLTQALVNKSQIAQSVSCYNQTIKLTDILVCSMIAKPNIKLEALESTFWAEIGKLAQDGPTAEEVESAQAVILTRQIAGLQRLGGFGGVADTLDEYEQYTGNPGYLPTDIATLQAVSPADIKTFAGKFLGQQQAVVVSCVAGSKVLNDVPRSPADTDADVKITNPYTQAFEDQQNFRKTPPQPGPQLAFHLPVPKSFTLKNGLTVFLTQDANLPLVTAQLTARAGSENNPAGKAGLGSFNSLVMGEATKTRDLTRLSQDEQRLGIATMGVSSTMDGASSSFTVTANRSDAAMDLLADIVEHPAFNPDDIERLRKRRLVAIAQQADNPSVIASIVGPELLYGNTPYGMPSNGTLASITAITPSDLAAFYSAHFAPSDSALSFAGDISEAEARKLAEKYFGNWSATASVAPASVPPPPAPPTRTIILIDKPGSPQTALQVFGLGHPLTYPDHDAIEVMDYTLGGAFASRINMNLREEHGYTYGASSYFSTYRQGGSFLAGGLVRTDITGPALTELFKEITNFPTNPPTAAELKQAKDSSIQSVPGLFETTAATASAESQVFLYNLPLDYYSTQPDKFRAVTPADVARVAKDDIHPDHLLIVAVGDRAKIEPGLKATNLGPIEYRTPTGDPIPTP